jgi:predicted transposase/invertase (TIGR01784 family)
MGKRNLTHYFFDRPIFRSPSNLAHAQTLLCYATMRTDTLFYQLFQTFHTLLFELTEQPITTAEGYEFVSVEVKEKAFRFDGVFLPNAVDKPIIFTEVQFQNNQNIYWDLMSEICMYLRQFKPINNCRAISF